MRKLKKIDTFFSTEDAGNTVPDDIDPTQTEMMMMMMMMMMKMAQMMVEAIIKGYERVIIPII